MSPETTRVLRTVVQTSIGLAVVVPAVVDAAGLPRTLPWVAAALAAAGAVTRVMALPGVQALLPRWMRTDSERPERRGG